MTKLGKRNLKKEIGECWCLRMLCVLSELTTLGQVLLPFGFGILANNFL